MDTKTMTIKEAIIDKVKKFSDNLTSKDLADIESVEMKKIGMDSMTMISFFLELEDEGYIDISEINYTDSPETVSDIITLLESSK